MRKQLSKEDGIKFTEIKVCEQKLLIVWKEYDP
jgi:hypothetical protein